MDRTAPPVPDERPRRPTPIWFGAVAPLLLTVAMVIFLTYALLDIGPQQALGPWNYLIAVVLVLLVIPAMRLWRGDFSRGWRRGPVGRARVRQNADDLRTLGRMFTMRP